MESGSVRAVVVTYNSAAVLPGLLDSLPAGARGVVDFGVIVVDNNSRDRSVEIARAHPLRPAIVTMGRNAGYAAAINAAAEAAGNEAHLGAPMPGVVSGVSVSAGQAVKAGDVLLSIEAMKMETALHAERDGTIAEVLVRAGDQIDAKDLLLVYA